MSIVRILEGEAKIKRGDEEEKTEYIHLLYPTDSWSVPVRRTNEFGLRVDFHAVLDYCGE